MARNRYNQIKPPVLNGSVPNMGGYQTNLPQNPYQSTNPTDGLPSNPNRPTNDGNPYNPTPVPHYGNGDGNGQAHRPTNGSGTGATTPSPNNPSNPSSPSMGGGSGQNNGTGGQSGGATGGTNGGNPYAPPTVLPDTQNYYQQLMGYGDDAYSADAQAVYDANRANNIAAYNAYLEAVNPYGITQESLARAGQIFSGANDYMRQQAYSQLRDDLTKNNASANSSYLALIKAYQDKLAAEQAAAAAAAAASSGGSGSGSSGGSGGGNGGGDDSSNSSSGLTDEQLASQLETLTAAFMKPKDAHGHVKPNYASAPRNIVFGSSRQFANWMRTHGYGGYDNETYYAFQSTLQMLYQSGVDSQNSQGYTNGNWHRPYINPYSMLT